MVQIGSIRTYNIVWYCMIRILSLVIVDSCWNLQGVSLFQMVGFVSFPGVLGRPHHHFGKCCFLIFLFDISTCRSFFFQNLLSPISGLAVRNGTSSCVQVFFVNRNNGATQLELPQAPLEDFAAEESRQIPEHRPQILSGTCAAAKHPWLMWKEGLARDALKQDCASKGIQ